MRPGDSKREPKDAKSEPKGGNQQKEETLKNNSPKTCNMCVGKVMQQSWKVRQKSMETEKDEYFANVYLVSFFKKWTL